MADPDPIRTTPPGAGPAPRQGRTALRMVTVMGSVGLFAAVALVVTYMLTLPRIQANRAAYLAQSITEVLPGAERYSAFVADGEGGFEPAPDGSDGGRVFAGYDEADSLVGLAVEAQGQGYADILRLLYGFDPDCRCVVGLKVLESKETPGLGDKIQKDERFTANFERLEVRADPDALAIEFVKNGQKTEAWQVEGITGATVSSRAVTDILARSTAALLPLLERHLDQLRHPPEG